ncbi:MAG: CAP domain-containing protein [Bdellovibrionales bacterium]|nr:CAP domain-containing protein [Bdellovibrionales bacterium]
MRSYAWLFLLGLLFSGCSNPASSSATRSGSPSVHGEVDPSLSALSVAIKSPEAKRAFDLVNQVRVSAGLAALRFEGVCQRAAQEHTENMISQNFFAHETPQESFRERMTRWDLLRFVAGENLAQTGSPEEAIDGWMNSPPHRKNILSEHFRSSGMAYKSGYYTQCFSGK